MTHLKDSTLAGVIYEFVKTHDVTSGGSRGQLVEFAFDLTNAIHSRIEGATKWVEPRPVPLEENIGSMPETPRPVFPRGKHIKRKPK